MVLCDIFLENNPMIILCDIFVENNPLIMSDVCRSFELEIAYWN